MGNVKMLARLLTILAVFGVASAHAAGGANLPLGEADIDPGNINSLQRGARNYMNYCSGCHSAKYVRFETIGDYLELSEEQLADNLMFNAEKTFETIRSAMPEADSRRWFGVAPPDLSLMARSKGVDYIYNFLKGFYLDPASPTGVDNLVLTGTSMPHVLWELQGYQDAVFLEHTDESADGATTTRHFDGFEAVTAGTMDAEDYDSFVRDTVNFLAYIAEPNRAERRMLGMWVIIYLFVFLIIARMLKKQIWKDVS
ncbi:MAG: cytochrome c1 [Woeseiaceae bacterium]|jgi:ubiquinol-cytochrome c reductase cytochrome c1 subunit